MSKIFLLLIELYQRFLSFDSGVLSVFCPLGACRQSPRCSDYAKVQINQFGVKEGLLLTAKRVWSCR